MYEKLKALLKKFFMEEPFPGGTLSKREERLIVIQITIAAALYATVVYFILTNEKFWTSVDRHLESTGLAVSVMRMLTGILLLIPIPGAAIAYFCKRIKESG
ncbi:MAG TPA: hypothetical protein PLR20_01645 [Syntrophales bacterium]|nr:hypothetical protein [Syntrophales bacterium]HOX95386.1 hypothetical protein [Syntrophales bacterium]HPI57178.1 hypothetical protein [Syntrophales bacterium]HPN23438.1 hypothetical protein [Syntrophales bacterium]HQM28037.1 hypothetical protein [Syntrophales bacterium]